MTDQSPLKTKITVAITGGPSGGKTTLIETIKKEMKSQLAIVPEAASILFRGGFPRRSTDQNKMHAQRAIYFTQKELESLVFHETKSDLIVCDRGSLDGIAYWPHDEQNFLHCLSTSREAELHRYQWVIHLDTAPYDQYDESNPVRVESFTEALVINERIRNAWRGHPQRLVVQQSADFLDKITKSILIIRSIIEGLTYKEILDVMGQDDNS